MKNLSRKYSNMAGIYIIKDCIKGRFYIGSSNNLYKRINSHLKKLEYNNHFNKFLQNHYNKYGNDSLTVEILEDISDRSNRKYIFEREQYWLKKLYSDKCFNAHTEVHFFINNEKQNIKHSIFMKKWLQEHPEHLIKLQRNLKKGRTIGNETKRYKKSLGHQYKTTKGYKTPEETKHKQSISAFKRGRNNAKQFRKVYQYDLNGNFIKEWITGVDAARSITGNYKVVSNIYRCCNGKCKKAMGFIWKFEKI